ncbi:MAG: outer membrane beta-barrel protein [Bacteroidota bacterium]
MKTISSILLTAALFCFVLFNATAQKNYASFKFGIKAAQPSGASSEEMISSIGAFTAGVRLEHALSKRFTLMTGVDLNARGFSFQEESGLDADATSFYFEHRIAYVDVPLAIRWQLGSDKIGLHFIGGTSLGFATIVRENTIYSHQVEGQEEKMDNSEKLDFEEAGYERFNAAILLGTGIYVGIGRSQLFFDLTMDAGLTPLIEGEDSSTFVGADFSLGIRMPLGK